MSKNTPDSTPPQPHKFQSMVARLRGMVQSLKPTESSPEEALPAWDVAPTASADSPHPEEAASEPTQSGDIPMAIPLAQPEAASQAGTETHPAAVAEASAPSAQSGVPLTDVLPAEQAAGPFAEDVPEIETPPAVAIFGTEDVATLGPSEPEAVPHPPAPVPCPICQSPRNGKQSYCDECGYIFPLDLPVQTAVAVAVQPTANPAPSARVGGRYELRERLNDRRTLERYRGLDHGTDSDRALPVTIVRMPVTAASETAPSVAPVAAEAVAVEAQLIKNDPDEILPGFDDAIPLALPVAEVVSDTSSWLSIAWEKSLLEKVRHPSLPAVVDYLTEDGYAYLIEEVPTGQSLWDAWDDPDAGAELRYGYLKQVAETLHALHSAGAAVESLRPENVVIIADGRARFTDVGDLIPLPLPPDPPIRATLYTAPELAACNPTTDARADLYHFGAMLYSLHVGRELTEMDFDRPGTPKAFIPRFPDIHPAFGRLMSKTFCHSREQRFPTDEAVREDASGFMELIRTLETCQRTLDHVRLEIAAWTTTGMIRTGNEDAFALLHAVESRQDDLGESALILLADGMGGYEAGEVAAALAIQALRKYLVQQKPFTALAGQSAFPFDLPQSKSNAPADLDVSQCRQWLVAALKDANKQVFSASRSGIGRRGMGCTAEAVFVNSRYVVVGHVGDSRTYHLHDGRLIQLTRDQTLVNRLVELGTLTPEEAETHPRRNELQQAVGGQPDVEPGIYDNTLKSGDWVVVCSDGVSNHITNAMLQEMLQSEAASAEMAARRLINLVNIEGATDNATVVVIRAT